MEDIHRDHIKNNIERLIDESNYDTLKVGCVRHGILSPVMVQNIELSDPQTPNPSKDELRRERHRKLFIKITKRGPQAYQKLKNLFVELDWINAEKLLNQLNNDDSTFQSMNSNLNVVPQNHYIPVATVQRPRIEQTVNEKLELYNGTIDSTNKPEVIKSNKIHVDKIGTYKMRSKENRGIFFMVNIIDFKSNPEYRRNGAPEDSESLLYLFSQFRFKLFAYENITSEQFFSLLKQAIESDYAKKTECFVLVVMTHGTMDDNDKKQRIQFHDGSIVEVNKIEQMFDNKAAPNLVNKPKILIFPFCRGELRDYGHNMRKVETDSFSSSKLVPEIAPTRADIIISYATLPGFKAHRDPENGNWYIQQFCKLMSENAHDTKYEDILKMIQKAASEQKSEVYSSQMGNYINCGFNQSLYFNPGYYDDKDDVSTDNEIKPE